MRNLFEPRLAFKPYEYPELLGFKDAIRKSYWTSQEYNYTPDIQDYKVSLIPEEREVIRRCMLAISQIEVTVKRFWADIYYKFPKPEVDAVGVTFAESEVRHADAYSSILELLGINDDFSKIHEIPALMGRVNYMQKFMKDKNLDDQHFVLSIILFSMFIEHISLFSQFVIMMSFNKYRNQFKGLSNAIQATAKEEEIHGNFGVEIFKILHIENRELFTDEFYSDLLELSKDAFKAEMDIIDWIYETTDLSFMPKDSVKEYVKSRYNKSLTTLGVNFEYPINKELLKPTEFFDVEVLAPTEIDFFNKRSVDYTKRGADSEVDDDWFN